MFSDEFSHESILKHLDHSEKTQLEDVDRVLGKNRLCKTDLPILLSKAASQRLETMAQRAHTLTTQRFGHTMKLFIPLYLSNECYNTCTYCGFSMNLDYTRKTLNDDEILKEALILKEKGFQHILLLTGESPKKVGVDYLENAIKLIQPHFASIGIEVQPMKTEEYKRLIKAGAHTLTVYQETYHKDSYHIYHLSGKKKQFQNRLNTTDYGGEAGFYHMNIGALFGLYEWRYEAFAIAQHLEYLYKTYWKTKLGISVPRIKKVLGGFEAPFTITDKEWVQTVMAFRLAYPDLSISLSTREPKTLRDNVFKLGFTDMSAESKTEPGGYQGQTNEEQFQISDERNLNEVVEMLQRNGYDPMLKDWDKALA